MVCGDCAPFSFYILASETAAPRLFVLLSIPHPPKIYSLASCCYTAINVVRWAPIVCIRIFPKVFITFLLY